jgi:hypothetical protein
MAQSQSLLPADTNRLMSFEELFRSIGQRDIITFYYQPGWFAGKKVHPSVATLPLADALRRVCSLSGLDFVVIDNRSVVFIPRESNAESRVQDDAGVMVIGNLLESGKYSRATVSGTITDGTTGSPLPGAIVAVEKLSIHAVTNRDGKYSFVLPAGQHTLTVKYVGYQDLAVKIRVVGDGECNLDVFEKSLQLQAVVITDQRADKNISRTQMSAFRLDAKTIKELPVTLGETDIIKSITLLPGVQSVGEFGSGFIVRGGNTDQNLVLVEDVPLFNSSHLFGLNSAINPDLISGVTLYKAGIPARYGERSSSVMAVKLGGSNAKTVKARGGIGLLNSRLTLEIPMFKQKVNLLLGGRTSYSDWLLQKLPDLDLQNSSAGFYDLNGLLNIDAGKHDKLSFSGYYSSDRFSFSRETNYLYSNLLASARWTHIFSSKVSTSLMTGMSRYQFGMKELDTLNPYDGNRVDFGIDYNNLKWAVNWFPGNRHSVEFGINGILYRNHPGELLPYGGQSLVVSRSVDDEKGVETAMYLSDDIEFSSRFSVEAGFRAVRFSLLGPGYEYVYANGLPRSTETITDTLYYGNNTEIATHFGIEPRIALRFSPDEKRSFKLSYTRIDQFVNLLSNTSVISPTDTWKLSDTYLLPVVSDQVAAGYFRNLRDNTVEASAEIYYKKLQNLPEYKNGASLLLNDHLATDVLTASGYSYGIELYLKKNAGNLTGWISYTYSRTKEKTSGTAVSEMINGNRYFSSNFDIPHNLVVNLNYHFTRRWRASATFTCHTGRPVTLPELRYTFDGKQVIWYSDRNKYRLPAYHRLDVAITRDQSLKLSRKWKSSWTLSVVNLYGRNNAYSAFYAREDTRTWNYSGNYSLYKLYILGVPLPTITYNFNF